MEDGYEIPSGDSLVDEIVADKLLLDMLMSALDTLTAEKRYLIDEIYFNGKSERAFAKTMGMSNAAVNKKHHRILDKLKKLYKNIIIKLTPAPLLSFG